VPVDTFQTLVLALIQGVTEFLPISSSAHLILVPVLTGWPDQGLAFDVAVHLGTLLAVVVYFRHELVRMTVAGLGSFAGRWTPDARLAWAVVFGTIPVVLVGLFGKSFIETALRGPVVIGVTAILFGVVLWWADVTGKRHRDEFTIGWREAAFVGVAQALAREAAARFSFLLSIPTLLASNVLVGRDLLTSEAQVEWGTLLLGAAVAALSAYACIGLFIRLLARTGMLPYVIYRVLLGIVLLWLFL
jgi:undecaprenyl-diphosphatase